METQPSGSVISFISTMTPVRSTKVLPQDWDKLNIGFTCFNTLPATEQIEAPEQSLENNLCGPNETVLDIKRVSLKGCFGEAMDVKCYRFIFELVLPNFTDAKNVRIFLIALNQLVTVEEDSQGGEVGPAQKFENCIAVNIGFESKQQSLNDEIVVGYKILVYAFVPKSIPADFLYVQYNNTVPGPSICIEYSEQGNFHPDDGVIKKTRRGTVVMLSTKRSENYI